MTKNELRKKYKILRKALSVDDVDTRSLSIANNLLKLDVWKHNVFHIFLPIEEQYEVNTEFILNILSGKDKDVVLSKSNFENIKMTHYLLTDNTRIKKSKYNISEPVDGFEVSSNTIDVVFVPLLAFDNQGHRVGYGKGFYDNFLSECKKETIKIGLSFFAPEDEIEDIFKDDIPLDYCITPTLNYSF